MARPTPIERLQKALGNKTRGAKQNVQASPDDIIAACEKADPTDLRVSVLLNGCSQVRGRDVVVLADEVYHLLDSVMAMEAAAQPMPEAPKELPDV